MSQQRECLPRARRIRKRVDFEFAYTKGSRRRGALFTLFVARTSLDRSRVGVAVTRKLGSSVTRNRAKRLAREVLRRHSAKPGRDVVLVPKRDMLAADVDRIGREFLVLLGRDAVGRPSSDN